jgi:23S rRNA pseudouridine1911/1915/1917 synthase
MTRLRASETDFTRPAEVPEGAVVSIFRVPPEVAGQRLDVFLTQELRRTSRTRAQEIIRASAWDDRGRKLRSNDRVQAEQKVLLWRAAWDETPVPQDVPILYEDDHLMAVSKPSGLPVHPTARYHKNTLIVMLKAERPGMFLSLGHRIDRETSGVLLLTKTAECDRMLKKAFEERDDIDKSYLALTWGIPRTRAAADADAASEGEVFRFECQMALPKLAKFGVKMEITGDDCDLHSATRFTVEGTRTRTSDQRAYARVRCDLESGRQHQIRLHLAALGSPIVGDKLYGPDDGCFPRGADGELTEDDLALLELPRHALHARALSFNHPMTGQRLTIEAPLPDDLTAFWDSL